MVSQNYFNEGFSDVFLINIKDKLDQLQKVIYELTKEYLVDHDNTIEILERLNLSFKTEATLSTDSVGLTISPTEDFEDQLSMSMALGSLASFWA